MFDANPNQCARYEVKMINSIFKHSQGYVMTRWNNNKPEYHVTVRSSFLMILLKIFSAPAHFLLALYFRRYFTSSSRTGLYVRSDNTVRSPFGRTCMAHQKMGNTYSQMSIDALISKSSTMRPGKALRVRTTDSASNKEELTKTTTVFATISTLERSILTSVQVDTVTCDDTMAKQTETRIAIQ